ncbi:response regulator [Egbenema bharatensis]|uniref:response regulator n=1 Tax=Egbenema bharatensis TaxID=3463334 RepID=UPI003A843E80
MDMVIAAMETSTKQILIIEDEDHIREVVQTCLQELGGWKVAEAASGVEGLMRITEQLPDAILLDLMMPEMDGFEFLERLNGQFEGSIPVVLLTAKPNVKQSQLVQLGVIKTIAKPFNPLSLPHQIAEALGWEIEIRD